VFQSRGVAIISLSAVEPESLLPSQSFTEPQEPRRSLLVFTRHQYREFHC
jgi:hypothetical protein